jgi:Ca2+-binding RTX toxin-like protein
MPLSNHRAPVLLALVTGALALGAGQADAAITQSVQERTLTVTGDAAADRLALRIPAADPTKLQLDVGDDGTAEFTIPRSTVDAIRVLAGAGNDTVRVDDAALRAPASTPISIDGQAGADTLLGGRSADQLTGGDGDDAVEGNGGNDAIALGAGNDRATWDPGDGMDKVDGGDGFDRVAVDGTDAADQLRVLADGTRVRLMRAGATAVYTTTLERADMAGLGGDDTLDSGDVTGTALQEVHGDLAAGDDRVTLVGSPADDFVSALPSGSDVAVIGLSAFVTLAGADRMTIDGRDGDDRIAGGSVTIPVTQIGGAGDDQLTGTNGADTLVPGDGDDFVDGNKGDDTIRMGAGDDVFSTSAGDGRDRVDGEDGRDALIRSGSAGSEQWTVGRSGARARLAVGGDSIDGGTMEAITLFSFGGADQMTVGDLSGTGITAIDASLFDFAVPGGDLDVVRVDGTAGADSIRVASGPTGVKVTGLPATVTITGASTGNDRIEVFGGEGEDRIDSADLGATAMLLRADGQAGDDLLLGGIGDDILSGGDGNDVLLTGRGDNVAFGGAGDDLALGAEGDDVLDGGVGKDRLIGGGGDDVILNGES